MQKVRVLTGVKPTGMPHLGNYLGAIRPAIELAGQQNIESFLFIADYHALTNHPNSDELKAMTYEVAATWLALGVDPNRTVFYRQSDVPEVFELNWILSCFTEKGLMNRAHAYKARVAENEAASKTSIDEGINMGLYGYPVLMTADIVLYDADQVPVGQDQVQHLEIARDIVGKFNHHYRGEALKAPGVLVQKELALVPGLDGRKMSKSYNNHIPLFVDSKKLRKLIMKIKTDSTPPEDPKDPASSEIFTLYKHIATKKEVDDLRHRYQQGIGWGEAKQALFEVLDEKLKAPRERYGELMGDTRAIDSLLEQGAVRARQVACNVMNRVRKAIGKS